MIRNSRNQLCYCGSGKRFKHCHGTSDVPRDASGEFVTDRMLLDALKRADSEGMALGEEPSYRSIENISRALKKFGYESFIIMGAGTPPIVERAQKLNNLLFMPNELQAGGMHLGVFMFRDMFCRLYAPIAFGECSIKFLEMVDLSEFQKRWLMESPDDFARFVDQSADVLDFGYGWGEFGDGREIDPRGRDLIWRAHVQLEAAAATATAAFDFRGTIQSALLGTELALKAGLAACGVSDDELKDPKKIGHNLENAAIRLGGLCKEFDVGRVLRVLKNFPNFVESRYKIPAPSRIETGHILMGAQYIASEVTRQFSDRNVRKENPNFGERFYPV